ncbi:anthranilate synthase component II [Pseudidiomarina taiwanensis]|uniref:anthranilate synthase n=1 Tax=Pseudidiomarina taiwanensis TaxID=337250 RepID=A0A432ZNR4_9GAMM|nr:gamma-glutamyl-gamma-aminobutyrate hydrolase family protein [Pseudidiomarina taiwanensis]RUO79539.1 anthranilate synthase component II [Pseudidiomarina taiwanensis]
MNQQAARIILIDNYDSFAYNLVDELRQLGYPLTIFRNQVAVEHIIAALESYQGPQLLCISPGPGHPQEAGNLLQLIAKSKGRWPILGICLGFQALVHAAGGVIDRCAEVRHGKKDLAETTSEHPIFNGLSKPLTIARYHSLSAYQLPASVKVLARTGQVPMAAYFEEYHALGLQFHPESILTTEGSQLLRQCVEFLLPVAST